MAIGRNPRMFDDTRPLVMARFATLHEHDMNAGDPLTIVDEVAEGAAKGELTKDIAIRLWLSGYAIYENELRPTPVESAEDEAERLVTIEDLGGGWFLIRAPWLGEGEKVQGKDAAEARRTEIMEKGDTKGVTIEAQPGGWYTVTAPWLDESERIRGKVHANDRYDALIAEGPPEGWRLLTQEEKDAAAAEEATKAAARAEADRIAAEGAEADKAAVAAAAEAARVAQEEADAKTAAEAEQARLAAEAAAPEDAAPEAQPGDTPAVDPTPASAEAPAAEGDTQEA